MASITLRPFAPARARISDVESLTDLHMTLVRQRQELRTTGAALLELEQNRLAIVQCQWELSRALIARYLFRATAA